MIFQEHKKNDVSKIISILIIFSSISFLVLSTFNGRYDFSYNMIYIRSWQYLLAVFSGGALGVAGFLLQKLTKNSLSDVSILGIGSLNIIFIIFYIIVKFDGTTGSLHQVKKYLPLVSIGASILGTGIVYYLSKKNKKNTEQFILVGISMQFLFEAINIAFLSSIDKSDSSMSAQITNEISNYSYGRFPNIAELSIETYWRVITITSFVFIFLICMIIYIFKKEIDLMELNEDLAKSYGVKTDLLKKFLYFCVAILAGIESALVGTISLLGIIAPNISKIIFGNRSSTNIFSSFLIGAILVLSATFVSVNLSQNIPIGILSTAIVVPVFMYLIFKKK